MRALDAIAIACGFCAVKMHVVCTRTARRLLCTRFEAATAASSDDMGLVGRWALAEELAPGGDAKELDRRARASRAFAKTRARSVRPRVRFSKKPTVIRARRPMRTSPHSMRRDKVAKAKCRSSRGTRRTG